MGGNKSFKEAEKGWERPEKSKSPIKKMSINHSFKPKNREEEVLLAK